MSRSLKAVMELPGNLSPGITALCAVSIPRTTPKAYQEVLQCTSSGFSVTSYEKSWAVAEYSNKLHTHFQHKIATIRYDYLKSVKYNNS